jgi:hypothetical protein
VKLGRERALQVLGAVHRHVDLAAPERLLDLRREHPAPADGGERHVGAHVARWS